MNHHFLFVFFLFVYAMETPSTEEYSLIKLQALARTFIIRSKLLKQIRLRYEKIYDPKRRRFYYYDKVADKSSWIKPVFLLGKDIDSIAPTYSPEKAALMIQRVVRSFLSLLKVRLLYQTTVMKAADEQSGQEYYYNPKTGSTMWNLPLFMKNRLDYSRREPTATISDAESDESNEESLDSEAIREKRRKKRKFPRSRAQALVDHVEDNPSIIYELDLSNLGSKHITSRIYDLTELKVLNLSYNYLRKISPDIQYLSKLEILDVRHNRLLTLPMELRELSNLKELYASHNRIEAFSGHLYKLTGLKKLDLSHNLFVDLPVETGNLELLQELGLFEIGISQLQQLTLLDLSHCKLDTWPTQSHLLACLKELYLSHNQIPDVPDEIQELKELTILHLDHNLINELPSAIYSLPLLELVAHHNLIRLLPAVPDPSNPLSSLLALPSSSPAAPTPIAVPISASLTSLDLSYNHLQRLEFSLTAFASITSLQLQHNQLSKMAAECFQGLTKLRTLDLSYNQLAEVAPSLGNATALEELRLSYNKLVEVPGCLLRCSRLRHFQADHNSISNMSGKVLTMFILLEHLELQYNQILSLPSLLFTIKKLLYVDCSHNRISDLPDSIGQWSRLTYLDLSYNALPSLPATLCSIKELESLYLHYNRLSSFPAATDMVRLTKLRHLTLHHNSLTVSPQLLLHMPWLHNCDLSHNPIRSLHHLWTLQHPLAPAQQGGSGEESDDVYNRHMLYQKIQLLSEQLEDRHQQAAFIASKPSTPSPSAFLSTFIPQLYQQVNGDLSTIKQSVNEEFALLEVSISSGQQQPLIAMAHCLSSCYRFHSSRHYHLLQRECLMKMNKSKRWEESFLPSPAELQTSLGALSSSAAATVLGTLPFGNALLSDISACKQLLDHLHVHILAAHMHHLQHGEDKDVDVNADYNVYTMTRKSALEEGPSASSTEAAAVAAAADSPVDTHTSARSSRKSVVSKKKQPVPIPVAASNPSRGTFGFFRRKDTNASSANATSAEAEAAALAAAAAAQPVVAKDVSFQKVYDCLRTQLQASLPSLQPWELLKHRRQVVPHAIASIGHNECGSSLFYLPAAVHVMYRQLEHLEEAKLNPLWLSFEAQLLLAKTIIMHVQHVSRSIRWLERVSQQRFSVLDIAQRLAYTVTPTCPHTQTHPYPQEEGQEAVMQYDYQDLLEDVYIELTGEWKQNQKDKHVQESTIANKRAAMREQFYAELATALPPLPEGEEEVDTVTGEEVADRRKMPSLSRQSSSSSQGMAQALSDHPHSLNRHNSTATMLNSLTSEGAVEGTAAASYYATLLQALCGLDDGASDSNEKEGTLSETACDKVASIVQVLLIYRKLLLLWALQMVNSGLSILQAQGFDVTYDGSLDCPLLHVKQVGEHEMGEQEAPIKQRDHDTVLFVRRHARRCVYYRAMVYQYAGMYPEAVKSYQMYFRLSNLTAAKMCEGESRGPMVAKHTMVEYAKVLLAQGQFKIAQDTLSKIIKDYVMPLHMQMQHAQLGATTPPDELLEPIKVLPLDEEVAVLAKFAINQVQELFKANVFSSTQRRLFHVKDNGYLGLRTDWPPHEYQAGRACSYWNQVPVQMQKEQENKQELDAVAARREVLEVSDMLQRQARELLLKVKSVLPVR